jgi:hypothetical protein
MEFDLGAVLPSIQARTLVVHRTGNGMVDVESARAAAKRIPYARWAELPGADDLLYLGDADALLDVIQEFLTGRPAPAQGCSWPVAAVRRGGHLMRYRNDGAGGLRNAPAVRDQECQDHAY